MHVHDVTSNEVEDTPTEPKGHAAMLAHAYKGRDYPPTTKITMSYILACHCTHNYTVPGNIISLQVATQ